MRVIIQFLYNIFISIDQLVNTLLLGHPDETLSSRLGRARLEPRYFWVSWIRHLVNILFFFDSEERYGRTVRHCEKSVMPLEQMNFRKKIDYEIWSWGEDKL